MDEDNDELRKLSFSSNDPEMARNQRKVSSSSTSLRNYVIDEPELEFDDSLGTELEYDKSALDVDSIDEFLLDDDDEHLPYWTTGGNAENNLSSSEEYNHREDLLADADFEDQLGCPAQNESIQNDPDIEFREISKYDIIQVVGDDCYGRKVIVFSACRLPSRNLINHEHLLQYMKHTLNAYVENDYTLVYFHHGLTSQNKPSYRWLRQAYREFDRKYKKNLKALYIVHPSSLLKFFWRIFNSIISGKFKEKILYIDYLHELAQHLHLNQLVIPKIVKDYDEAQTDLYTVIGNGINSLSTWTLSFFYDSAQLVKHQHIPVPTSVTHPPLVNQQFGVSLQFIKEHNANCVIPPVLQQCADYIRLHGMQNEGIFRRSAKNSVLKQVQEQFNRGDKVDFSANDIHIPCAIFKGFLRQLPEPLLTFDLYDHIIHIQTLTQDHRLREMKRLVEDELPSDNKIILDFILKFLNEVTLEAEHNLMTPLNLSVVFGPNLLWNKTESTLTSINYVNNAVLTLIGDYHVIFNQSTQS